ncbi:DUF6491 family protein [Dasania sp. GY-MA-18]|uniref:DUF6491 family protein n=1 Tax=Dasania phycosphaerae TaxID=2950436 RepID=A0A9J6RSA5_9GAMM|nr:MULTISPECIES: DUF6491 family protein [Dasania]MCR8924381.1 DUF6491 family protein [Dasania sp. GY-MA-18]MCZ0867056.1 DUF6491 family protein [Dasania phycosphaerae]MCZ0870508.1 DUF6491 family protein [Dasania phycosphaerae]
MKFSLSHLLLSTAAVSLVLLSACSSTPRPSALSPEQAAAKHGYTIVKPVKQVHDYRLNGWAYIDQQNLVMYSSPGRSYLLTFKQRCHELRAIENIALDTRTGTLMAGLDAIKVLPRHSKVLHPCYIEGIYLLIKTKDSHNPDSNPPDKHNPDSKGPDNKPRVQGASDLAAR